MFQCQHYRCRAAMASWPEQRGTLNATGISASEGKTAPMHMNGRRLHRAIIAIAVGLIAGIASWPASAVQTYTATRLGTLGGGQSFGSAINSSGHVTGTSSIAGE